MLQRQVKVLITNERYLQILVSATRMSFFFIKSIKNTRNIPIYGYTCMLNIFKSATPMRKAFRIVIFASRRPFVVFSKEGLLQQLHRRRKLSFLFCFLFFEHCEVFSGIFSCLVIRNFIEKEHDDTINSIK